jgi:hypothetical protein
MRGKRSGSFPLPSSGEASASSSSQVRFLDFLQYLLGSHPGKGLGQRGVPADCQIIIDALRIDQTVGSENKPLLVLVEGDIRFVDDLLMCFRIGIEQTVYDLLLPDRLRHDLRIILRLYPEIANIIRVNNDDGTLFTEAVATRSPDVHFITQAAVLDLGFKTCSDLVATGGNTGRSGA